MYFQFKEVRVSILRALWRIEGPTPDLVPELIAVLQDGNESASREAVKTLGLLGPEARDVVPILVRTMKHRSVNYEVHKLAAVALGAIGPDAQAAVPALLKACRNPQGDLYEVARTALRSINPAAADRAGIH